MRTDVDITPIKTGRAFRRVDPGAKSNLLHSKYAIPNDQAEQDRLDIIHHIYLMLYKGELHMAPINPNPQMILDVGTGTGIWAIDVAE